MRFSPHPRNGPVSNSRFKFVFINLYNVNKSAVTYGKSTNRGMYMRCSHIIHGARGGEPINEYPGPHGQRRAHLYLFILYFELFQFFFSALGLAKPSVDTISHQK